MSKPSSNISKLPKKGEPVASISDVKKLMPRSREYAVPVTRDGAKVTGLVVKVTPAGKKVWKLVVKSPISGSNVTKSQPLQAMSYAKAIEWAVRTYAEVKQGQHDKGSEIAEQAKQEAQTELNAPIVELARRRADTRLARGKIGQRTHKQDYVDIGHLEVLIGRISFPEFGRDVAKSIGKAINGDNTKRDKIPKLINKTYNSLPDKVKSQIPYQPKYLLADEVLPHKQVRNIDALVPQDQMGLFWSRLMRADIRPIHKDLLLMCLLTGERISAVIQARIESINWVYGYLYLESKGSNGQVSKNPVPITKYLGLLLRRLAGERETGWLFPALRTAKLGESNATGHMAEPSRKLYDQLGSYRTVDRLHNHALRRTLANVCASAIGSQKLADEHVLHHTSFNSGAGPNYLDGNSQEFLETRRRSYEASHDLINDLLLSQGSKVGGQVYDSDNNQVGVRGAKQPAPHYMIAEAIVFGRELGLDWYDCGEEPSGLLADISFDTVDESNTALTVKVTSPLAFMCNGGPVPAITVSPTQRPRIWNALPTTVDYIKSYLDADYIQANPDKFWSDQVGHEAKPKAPDYISQFN